MQLIDETTNAAEEIVDVATKITATAADLAIEGAQAALWSKRRFAIPAVAVLLIALAAAVGYRRWRASKDISSRSDAALGTDARGAQNTTLTS